MVTLPSPNPVPNNATVLYDYNVSTTETISTGALTNDVFTQINTSQVTSTKYVNPSFAKVNDIINYLIVVSNSGNVTSNNVVLIDTIPNNTTFVNNSLYLDSVPQVGSPAPPTGFNISTIYPNQTRTITFQVTINTIPSPNPITNIGNVNYTYTVDPSTPNVITGTTSTNAVTTSVNQATLGSLGKYVNKSYAKVGDILTYTIVVTNTGNTTANNAVFTDTIPTGTSFVSNSVYVNGSQQVGASPAPPTGVTLGTINPLRSTTIVFMVTITTIPNPNPIPNSGTINYTYTVVPTIPNGASGSGNTNIVNTSVNQATIDNTNGGGLIKYVDKAYAKVGDIINYTITLKNTGNVTANNVIFTDTIPTGTTFVVNSVYINLVNQLGLNPAPPSGFNAGNIAPNRTTTINFSVLVNTIPTPNPIPNNSTVSYNYTIDPAIPNGGNASGNSNTVTTKINQASIDTNGGGLTKYVDNSYANINDILTYKIVLKNTGNVTANNIIFKDTTPNGTTFNTTSVFVNTVNQPLYNPNPPSGFNVGSLAPGFSTTITFTVTINTIPNPNPIPNSSTVTYSYTVDPVLPNSQNGSGNSNLVYTQVNSANFPSGENGLVKYVNKSYSKVGDTLVYTLVLSNKGNITANNVVLTDTIPNNTEFIPGTVSVDYINKPTYNPTPPTGISLNPIGPNFTTTVIFNVTVVTLPTVNPIINSCKVAYTFTVNPSQPNSVSGANISNAVNTVTNQPSIDNNNGSGLIKYVNKAYAQVGEILTYTIALTNTGNVTANNIIFIDTIPSGTGFVSGSVILNGVSQPAPISPAPPGGLSAGSLPPFFTTTIAFNVIVQSIPTPNPIPNSSVVNYTFTLDPAIPDGGSGSGLSNTVNTQVNSAIIDNTTGGGLVKYVSETYGKVGDTLIYTITLKNTGNIAATNVILRDTIPNDTTLVSNSVYVNGVSQPIGNQNPATGISVPSIASGATATIVFSVTVNTIPNPNPIPNNSTATFNFTVDPANPSGVSGSGNSNQVTTSIYQAIIDNGSGGLTKYVNKNNATVGDTLLYTIVLKNTGNVTANNVVLTDTIPTNTTFVPNSLYLNGILQPGANPAPPSGFNLGTLIPGQATTIIFNVTIVNNPTTTTATIPNSATASFQFINNPSNPIYVTDYGNSNIVLTNLNYASISTLDGSLIKYTNKQRVQVGEDIKYTIVIKNTGTTAASNVNFYDTIPIATSYVANTLTLNGSPVSGNPQTGVLIGSLNPNSVATITFDVTVTTIPTNFNISNNADVAFTYVTDPSLGTTTTSRSTTNTVNNPLANVSFSQSKSGNKSFVDIGDIVTYTLVLNNTGNTTSNSTIIQDTIPYGTAFVDNSLTVNNVPIYGINPQNSYNIGALNPSSTAVISFNVKVVSIPSPNPITNNFNTRYIYNLNSLTDNLTTTLTSDSNSALYVNNGTLTMSKAENKSIVTVPDTLIYSFSINNGGNVEAQNIVFKDTIPVGTSFVPGSLLINGVSNTGNPVAGVSLLNIPAGGTTTLSFQVSVVSVPKSFKLINNGLTSYNYVVDPAGPLTNATSVSNDVIATLNIADLSVFKASNSSVACLNDDITFTISIKNNGNVTASGVYVLDTLPSQLVFKTNSLYVNNVNIPYVDISTSGATIANISPFSESSVVFSASLVSLPSSFTFTNRAIVNYNYSVTSTIPVFTSTISNTITLVASPCLDNTKTINPCIISITSTLPSTKSLNSNCSSCVTPVTQLSYKVLGLCTAQEIACISQSLTSLSMWSENVYSGYVTLDSSSFTEIESIEGSLKLIRNQTIQTPTSCGTCNLEGKYLTGYKQIVEGIVNYTVNYVDTSGNFLSCNNCGYFSTFVVLPSIYAQSNLYVNGCIEDMLITKITNDTISLSALTLVYLTTLPKDCNNNFSCLSTCDDIGCISNSNLYKNISGFLSPCECYWSEFNAYHTEEMPTGVTIQNLVSLTADATVLSYKVITTPESYENNEEGLFLTGKKLFVSLYLSIKINYLPDDGTNTLRRRSFSVPCSTYIVLQDTVSCKDKFKIYVAIEDVYACLVDSTSVFSNTTLIIKATQCP